MGKFVLLLQQETEKWGYNLKSLTSVVKCAKVPVIANGGCGSVDDMHKALRIGVSAVAASSMFLYTDITPKECTRRTSEARMSSPYTIESLIYELTRLRNKCISQGKSIEAEDIDKKYIYY